MLGGSGKLGALSNRPFAFSAPGKNGKTCPVVINSDDYSEAIQQMEEKESSFPRCWEHR